MAFFALTVYMVELNLYSPHQKTIGLSSIKLKGASFTLSSNNTASSHP